MYATTYWASNFHPVLDAISREHVFDRRMPSARNLITAPLWFLAKGPRGRHVRTPLVYTMRASAKTAWEKIKEIGTNIGQQSVVLFDSIVSRIPERKEKTDGKENRRGRHRSDV
jgi:hypothetical protein